MALAPQPPGGGVLRDHAGRDRGAVPVRRARTADPAAQREALRARRRRPSLLRARSPRRSASDVSSAEVRRPRRRRGARLRRPRDAAAGHPSADRPAALAESPTRASSGATTPLSFPRRDQGRDDGQSPRPGSRWRATGTVAEAAYPVEYQGRVGGGDRLLRPGLGHRPQRRDRAPRDPGRRRDRAAARAHRRLPRGARAGRARQAARARRREGGGGRLRPPDRRSTRPTSSASWRSRSTRCSASSGSSRRRARSSSRPRRTSCARRSSRSEGSSSCSRTRTSIRRRGARFLDQVHEQVERLRKLSVDLLDLSRLESGSLELRPEQVDLGELTRSVSGSSSPRLAQHDSHLELRLPSRTIEAVCDPVRVAQIMRILIDNALTHTQPGHPDRGHRRHASDGTRPPGRARRRRRDRPAVAVCGSSSRSTPPTTPRGRASGWRSPPSSPSGCTGACRSCPDRETRRSPWSCRSMATGRPCTRPAARRRRRGSRHERPVSWPMTTTTGPELVLELGQQLRERVLPELGSHAGRAHAGERRGRRRHVRGRRARRGAARASSWPSGRRGWRSTPRTAAWSRRPTPPTCWSSTRSTAPGRRWPGWSRRAWRWRWRRSATASRRWPTCALGCVVEIKSGDWYLADEGRRACEHADRSR